jgi:hypothetical protein
MGGVGQISSKSFRSRLPFSLAVTSVAAIAFAILLSGVLASAQSKKTRTTGPQERPSAFVLGRVVDASTKQPIANARVSLGGRDGGRGAETVLTNSGGYFLFRDLAAGTFSLTARADGYLDGGLGQRIPGGRTQPMAVGAGERRGDVSIALFKAAVLSGVVTDERGDGVAGVSVTLLPRDLSARRGPARVGLAPSIRASVTDVAGAYQFSGLLPGEYYVAITSRIFELPAELLDADAPALENLRVTGSVELGGGLRGLGTLQRIGDSFIQSAGLAGRLPINQRQDGVVTGYASTYFPAATSPATATALSLAVGEHRPNVNIQLRPVAFSRVSGRLTGPDGPLSGWSVHLLPAFAADSDLERAFVAGTTATTAGGAFSFAGVPAGDYVIKAWRLPSSLVIGTDPLPGEPTLWASMPITVGNRALGGIDVVVRPGSVVRGRIVLEGAAPPLAPVRFQTLVSLAFEPSWSMAFSNRLSTRVNPAFEFETMGLPAGRATPTLPNNFTAPGWFFESATRESRDVMIEPITFEPGMDVDGVVLRFSDRRTTLSGSVLDAAGRPYAAAAVVVFPADHRRWVEHGLAPLAAFEGMVTEDGSFSLDVRPGEYLVAAIDERNAAAWRRDPAISALAPQSVRVTIARGENTVQALRVVQVREPRP